HEAAARAREALGRGAPYEPKHFTAHEWDTVRLLVDLIIPKDDRSGGATDAGVPEFMDFMLGDDPDLQTPIRGGLAWLDHECDDRWTKTFVACSDAERTALLDDIAWPKKAKPEHAAGVAFFNSFRDFTASGFFSSKLGVWSPNGKHAEDMAAQARRLDLGPAKAHRSIADMVADPAIDALWLCGPNQARVENVEEIADAVTRGKGALKGIACEKPLARNVAEAQRVTALV